MIEDRLEPNKYLPNPNNHHSYSHNNNSNEMSSLSTITATMTTTTTTSNTDHNLKPSTAPMMNSNSSQLINNHSNNSDLVNDVSNGNITNSNIANGHVTNGTINDSITNGIGSTDNDIADDNDWLILSDENVRIKKQYEKLRYDYNDLEYHFDTVMIEKSNLQQLLQLQQEKLINMKNLLNETIDVNDYDKIWQEYDALRIEYNELLQQNKQLRSELNCKQRELKSLQSISDELQEQNRQLREQSLLVNDNREMTTRLLCDIELMQLKINEYLISISDLSDENQELRRLLDEQHQQQHQSNDNQNKLNRNESIITLASQQLPSQQYFNHYHQPSYQNVMMLIDNNGDQNSNSNSMNETIGGQNSKNDVQSNIMSKSISRQNSFVHLQSSNSTANNQLTRCSLTNLSNSNHQSNITSMLPRCRFAEKRKRPPLSSSSSILSSSSMTTLASFGGAAGVGGGISMNPSKNNVETMADIIIDDMERQMEQMKHQISSLEAENQRLQNELKQYQQPQQQMAQQGLQTQQPQQQQTTDSIDNDQDDPGLEDNPNDDDEKMDEIHESKDFNTIPSMVRTKNDHHDRRRSSLSTEDRSIQTDPIILTIESKQFIRCPFDHQHNGLMIMTDDNGLEHHNHPLINDNTLNNSINNHDLKKYRFGSIRSLMMMKLSKNYHHHHPYLHQSINGSTNNNNNIDSIDKHKQPSTTANTLSSTTSMSTTTTTTTTTMTMVKSSQEHHDHHRHPTKKKRKRKLFCLF